MHVFSTRSSIITTEWSTRWFLKSKFTNLGHIPAPWTVRSMSLLYSSLLLNCWSPETSSTLCDPEIMSSSFGWEIFIKFRDFQCTLLNSLEQAWENKSKPGGFPLIHSIAYSDLNRILLDYYGRVPAACIDSGHAREEQRSKKEPIALHQPYWSFLPLSFQSMFPCLFLEKR
jgi:hypothetical protein